MLLKKWCITTEHKKWGLETAIDFVMKGMKMGRKNGIVMSLNVSARFANLIQMYVT